VNNLRIRFYLRKKTNSPHSLWGQDDVEFIVQLLLWLILDKLLLLLVHQISGYRRIRWWILTRLFVRRQRWIADFCLIENGAYQTRNMPRLKHRFSNQLQLYILPLKTLLIILNSVWLLKLFKGSILLEKKCLNRESYVLQLKCGITCVGYCFYCFALANVVIFFIL